ncbi:esterase OVCA2 [Eublepharis macularius]|uniref:Esterase OVCA2 n=1 Tax=Eublepharis macularius TaxID=481883 RepID=A0AA97KKJ4_EUBMA|nr:esterase OVCA2 [Eublepharis macularius]
MAEGGSGPRSLRLLCLHGYRQDATSFRARSGALRKALRGRAELLTVDAPHVVAARAVEASLLEPTEGNGRSWWFSSPQERTFSALEEASSCKGLEESLKAVAEAFAEYGPIDGLLGFSQGAALTAIVCALKQRGDPRFQFDFAILFAGFKSQALDHQIYYQEPIQVPSLHVLGETDRVISAEMSQELSSKFTEPLFLTHPGGHFIPASAAQKKTYLEFLDRFGK